MTVKTKHVPLTQAGLAERMALHKPGQITWPEPSLGQKCSACRFFSAAPKKAQGICSLVKVHTRKAGKPFDRTATACPKFEARA